MFFELKKTTLIVWLVALLGAGTALFGLWLLSNHEPAPVIASIPENLEAEMVFERVRSYPHDPDAFTQGLVFVDGDLYESTGLYGESSLRKVDLETGAVLERVQLPADLFAEGLTDWGDTLIQLTWKNQVGLIYRRSDLALLDQFTYPTEGWGLTHDDQHLILSDGTAMLRFLDPATFAVVKEIEVLDAGVPVNNINELEFIRGEVYANIWQTDKIIRIDPQTGLVLGRIDLEGLLPDGERQPETDILNGIAYLAEEDRLFVTGKYWPYLYEIRLVPEVILSD